MRTINEIFIHCAATLPKESIRAATIRRWHKRRGWSDIGYHFVICTDGAVEHGRPLERVGAHAKGHNRNSIGICLVGGVDANGKPEANFTEAQWYALDKLLADLETQFPQAAIRGHNEVAAKACPSFDVQDYLVQRMVDNEEIIEEKAELNINNIDDGETE